MTLSFKAALAASALVAMCATAAANDPVGNASAIIPSASQQTQGTKTDLVLRDNIIRNADLATAAGGALEVTFLDGSKLTMGQNSRVTVDEYVYTGPGGTGKQSIRYAKGLFRFVSGSIPKDQVKVQTPTVTIGIRGTVFRVVSAEGGGGAVSVEEGETTIKSNTTGETVVLKAGEMVSFDAGGGFSPVGPGEVPGC